MKKLLFTFFAIMLLGTSAWAGSVTKIGNGQYRLDITMTEIATANSWSSGTKTTFMIGDHIQFVGPTGKANATLYNASTGGKGARVYETQNQYGVTKIGVHGVIDTLTLTYVVGNAGVISLTKDTLGPVPAKRQIVSGTKYPLKKDTLYFYVGRTDGTKKDGKCDITNVYAVYTLYPSSVTMDETKTVSVGDAFQIGQVAPLGAYQVWSSNNENAVTVDQNGTITAKAAGEATITMTSPTITKSCVITVVAKSGDKTFVESLTKVGTMSTWNAGVKNYDGETNGIKWAVRNFQRNTSDMIGGVQGTEIRNDGTNNYIAYQNINIEGGVKRIAFQWRATDATKPVYFDVDGTIAAEPVFKNELQASADYASAQYFCREIGMAKNYQFRIRIANKASSTVVFGPLTITPYLFYTTKTAEANGKYTNTGLINNTPDTATIVYTLENNDGEASIDAATGEVTCLAEGEVTVRATWGKVSTTYTLKTHVLIVPEMSFEADTLNKDIYDAPFINALTTTAGVGDTTYTSSDESVATVDTKGQVTILAGGTTTITASVAATATYATKSASYVLNVDFTPQEGAFWKETFKDVPQVKNYNGTDKYVGDSSVYNWKMTYYQRQDDDMVGTYQGTRVRYSGTLAMDGVQEGGIKAIRFDYRAANQVNPIHFNVNVDGVDYEYYHAIMPVKGTIATYAQKFEVKKNTQFAIKMNAQEDPQQGYPIFGPITIAPYLLYTVKSMEKKQEEGSFTNTALINNAEGDVVYSVEGENADKIASIDASTGEVTILGEGVVTVKAAWGDVYTTYTLIAHTKTVPEISFAADTLNKDMLDAAFANALTTTAGVGDTTYTSSNEKVATVAANGEVSIVGVGQTTITATIAENATFAEASASYVLNVGFTPAAGTFWKETFSKRNPQKSKDGGDIKTVGDSAVYNWVLNNYDYNTSDNFDGVVGVRVRYDGYMATKNMEGGIKALAFDWRASNNTNYIHYTVIAGKDTTVFDRDPIPGSVTNRFTFARKYEQKSNTSFKFTIDTAGLKNTVAFLGVSPITITPYLLYTTKKDTLDMKEKKTYQMVPQIDNRDDEVAIQYSFVEQNVDFATIDPATGEVTATAGGVVTVKAAWGEVYTTYQLTILNDKTTIYLVRNDGTENVDTIVNNCGEVAPTITLPTREGYQFNAYWTKPDTAKGSYRFTVTTAAGATVWVSNRTINKEKVTGDDRIWIYAGSFYTLYADWRTERTITLDNQEATEAGTDKVVTAYCPNNNMLRLTTSITCPTKTGYAFAGYYTAAEGQGSQLIDATGAFKASVAGYTDKDKWFIKDADITLYAYWVENTLTIDEEDEDLATLVADNDGKSANVTLKRAMTADGTYNTIYLPFALTSEQVTAVFGANAKVAELISSTLADNVLSLNFDFVTEMEAGKPYLVAPTQNVAEAKVQVTISKEAQESSCESGDFHGILAKQSIAMADKYFLGNENKLITYTAITDYTTKGLRAYFTLNNPAPGVQARCVIGRGTTTVLPFINGEAVSGTKKVIIDQRLVIIRDGKMYNAQGACLQ